MQSIIKAVLGICSGLLLLSGCADDPVTPLASPAGANSSGPNASVTTSGLPVLSWQRKQQDTTILEYSVLTEEGWSKPVEVAGTDWFVNWADILLCNRLPMRFGLPTICSVRPVSMPMMCDCAFLTTAVRTGATLVARIRMAPLPSMALFRFITRRATGIIWGRVKHVADSSEGRHGGHGSHGTTLRAAVMDAQGQLQRR